MKVEIYKRDPTAELPKYGTEGAAAFDLSSNENLIIQPKEIVRIKTGLIFHTPPGYFLAILPRSGMPKKKGLSMPHSIGVIDPDFSGPEDELLIQYYNFTDQPVEIKKGEKIAQGMFLEIPKIEWQEVKELKSSTSRGGFGSTGI